MRVAQLTSWLSRRGGGVSEAVRRLSQAVVSAGVPVEVFGFDDDLLAEDRMDWAPLQPRASPILGPSKLGFSPRQRTAVLASPCDILHVHGLWTLAALTSLGWARRTRRPYLISPHGMLDDWALARSPFRKRIAALLFEDRHLSGASCVHSLCEAETAAIRTYGLRSPVCQIPNGVDLPERPADLTAPWRRDDRVERTLLSLGRLHPKKGLGPLIEGWRIVRARAPAIASRWGLVIAGSDEGGFKERLEKLADEAGVRDSVVFPGPLFRADREAAYWSADAFALPSLSEGMPLVVLEAWAHRLPVIMTGSCNLPEGFAAGAALRTEPDAENISRSLERIFEMGQGERREMGIRGRELVQTRFTWDAIARQFIAGYGWLMGGGTPPDCVRIAA